MSSWDCLNDGESKIIVLLGRYIASHRANMAVIVDLPVCLEQFRIFLGDVDLRKDSCHGSGSKLRYNLANVAGSLFAFAVSNCRNRFACDINKAFDFCI